MSHQGNKKNIYYLLSIVFIFSCNKYKTYNEKEITKIRERSIEKSQLVINENEYLQIYRTLNDSIKNWQIHNLGYYKYLNASKEYLVDSILCFNIKGDKLITAILQKQLLKEGVQDDIEYFYGVKIKGQWYFFGGPTLVLPREYYQKNIHTPLSFEKLKQIATDHIYRNYLYKNKHGEWEINEGFFSDLTSGAWSSNWQTNTQEQWDSIYISIVKKKWEKNRKQ